MGVLWALKESIGKGEAGKGSRILMDLGTLAFALITLLVCVFVGTYTGWNRGLWRMDCHGVHYSTLNRLRATNR